MILPLLMAGSAMPTPSCAPDDLVAWACFILGFGTATFVLLVLAHVCKR
jgi:hypothetical protein